MKQPVRVGLVLVALSLFGIVTHLLPHDMGVSTVGAIGMLAAAYLPKHLLAVPVVVTVFAADALNGFYALLAMSFVYLGHVGAAFAVRPTLARVRPMTVISASLLSAVVFYLVSNLTPMAMGFYPPTVEGWLSCYVNGLPFLVRGVLANLAFGSLLFGAIWVVRISRAHRFAAAERH